MIVVDTNLMAALLLNTPQSAVAAAVYARDREWAAPLLWRSELRHVLVKATRRSEITTEAASAICDRARQLLGVRQHDVADGAVLRRAVDSGCTAYDCEFVALADRLGVPLVTFDREVLAAFPTVAIHPERFASGGFWGDRVSERMTELYGKGTSRRRRRRRAAA